MPSESWLVQEILKSLYDRFPGTPIVLDEGFALSPPSLPGVQTGDPAVSEQVERLARAGLAYRSLNDIQTNRGPFPTLRPTPAAREWAYLAQDDDAWNREWPRLKALLEQFASGDADDSERA